MSLRTGFFASEIVEEALAAGRGPSFRPARRRIYHEKTRAQIRTIDGLIDVLWYQGRLREHYSLLLNVDLDPLLQLQPEPLPHALHAADAGSGSRRSLGLHGGIDRFVRFYDRRLHALARRRRDPRTRTSCPARRSSPAGLIAAVARVRSAPLGPPSTLPVVCSGP